jgi:hypothetical protein
MFFYKLLQVLQVFTSVTSFYKCYKFLQVLQVFTSVTSFYKCYKFLQILTQILTQIITYTFPNKQEEYHLYLFLSIYPQFVW